MTRSSSPWRMKRWERRRRGEEQRRSKSLSVASLCESFSLSNLSENRRLARVKRVSRQLKFAFNNLGDERRVVGRRVRYHDGPVRCGYCEHPLSLGASALEKVFPSLPHCWRTSS